MITFRVNGLPPSYNKHFSINWNFRECTLTPEARLYKSRVKSCMPIDLDFDTQAFRIEIAYHSDFKYKNGKNKRIDIQNLNKLLIDAIFEKLGIDDSSIWEMQECKVQDTDEYTQVTLRSI